MHVLNFDALATGQFVGFFFYFFIPIYKSVRLCSYFTTSFLLLIFPIESSLEVHGSPFLFICTGVSFGPNQLAVYLRNIDD